MARRLAFLVVLLLAFSVAHADNILIIDNNTQLARTYNKPYLEHGMADDDFKAHVFWLIKKYDIRYRRLRWIKRSTMLQREEIDCAVLYGVKYKYL